MNGYPTSSIPYQRLEETRPFPPMTSTSPSEENDSMAVDESWGKDGSPNLGLGEESDIEKGLSSAIHPGQGGMFNLNPIPTTSETGPVRLTSLSPISPSNEDVYSSAELRSNPQPPISVRFIFQIFPFLLRIHFFR